MPRPTLVDMTFFFVRETEKAICVLDEAGDDVWLPKSQIEYELVDAGKVDVTLPFWLAQEKELA